MKTFTKVMLLLAALPFLSCKKESTTDTQPAYLSIINASPTIGTYNFYVNGTAVNTAAMPFGASTAYQAYDAGDYKIKFTTETSAESLLTKTVSLGGNTVYSFFLIDKEDKLDGLLITDDLTATSTEKAYIRFINLSPDAPNLDLSQTGESSLISSKSYKTTSAFLAVTAKDYTFDIRDTATAAVKASLASATLKAGRYYTIIAKGLLAPGNTDQPFSAQIITNL